jgi:hypothetical protein
MSEFLDTFGKGTQFHEISKLKQPTTTPSQIDAALDHPDISVRRAAISNPNASSDNITKALGNKGEIIRVSAAEHQNATPEHLEHAMSGNYSMRRAVAIHPNALIS